MSVVCTCPRDHLCEPCLAQLPAWHKGTAQCRGEHWAESVARRRPELLTRAWPPLEGRAHEIAVGKLADLSGDARAIEGLLVELQCGAERAWARAVERTGG